MTSDDFLAVLQLNVYTWILDFIETGLLKTAILHVKWTLNKPKKKNAQWYF